MKILIGVSGSIAAYKAIEIVSMLKKEGHEIHVIMTDAATRYCSTATIDIVSGGHLIDERPNQTLHISEGKWCDAFILVPATANTIAKIAGGIADNFLTSTILALPPDKIRVACPAMNTNMYENPVTQSNLDKLKKMRFTLINPVKGLLACGDFGIGSLPYVGDIVEELKILFDKSPRWGFPLLTKYRGTTMDSNSFFDYDINNEVEINLYPHVGAYGIRRRHDVHKGIDLYAKVGEPVMAVEDGEVIEVSLFTGEQLGTPWWNTTFAVYVKGYSGIVVYGEINPTLVVKNEMLVKKGETIGTVLSVLKKNKGRPTSMLHLELHDKDHLHTETWEVGMPSPEGLLDPTPYLIRSIKQQYMV